MSLGLDKYIDDTIQLLTEKLWIPYNNRYVGHSWILDKDGGKQPYIYNGSNEYDEVLGADKTDSLVHFYVLPNRDKIGNGVYKSKVYIMFAINLGKIYGSDSRSVELALKEAEIAIKTSPFKITDIKTDIEAYDIYDLTKKQKASFNMQPFYVFRFETEIIYSLNYGCGTIDIDEFDVTTSIVGDGTINSNPTTLTGLKKNTLVSLNATVNAGSRFVNWVIGGISYSNRLTSFYATASINAIATFIKQWTLTSSVVGNGTIDAADGTYDEGSTQTITATPASGSVFSKFTRNTVDSFVNPIVLTFNEAIDLVATFIAQYIYILDVFSTVPMLVGSDYTYNDLTDEGHDVIVKGRNYMRYIASSLQYGEFAPITIEDGDILSFDCKRDVFTEINYLFGNNASKQIRFNANVHTMTIFVSVGAGTISTGVDTRLWNNYRILFDITGSRIGLSVNSGAYTYFAESNFSPTPLVWIAKLSSTYSNVSFFDIKWQKANGVNKMHLKFCEGKGLPYDTISANKMLKINEGTWSNDTSLKPINILDGFRYENTKFNGILFMGQSNMCAQQTFAGVDAKYKTGFNHIYSYKSNGATGKYQRLDIDGLGIGGIEISFGYGLQALNKKTVMIKGCINGTSMHTDWQKGGTAYTQFAAAVANMKAYASASGIEYKPRVMNILQAESDSDTEAHANAYVPNFTQMRSDMIADGLIDSDTIFIFGKIVGTAWPYREIVNTAFATIVATWGGAVIETSDIPKVDSFHYSALGQITLGERFLAAYLTFNFAEFTTTTKQLIPILDDLSSASDGLAVTNTTGFSDADSIVVIPTDATLNTYLSSGNKTFTELVALENSDNIEITKTANNISSLKVRVINN